MGAFGRLRIRNDLRSCRSRRYVQHGGGMNRRYTKQTAKDFPAEFLDAWKLAVEKKLLVSFESAGTARNWIQRMYTFRKRLMEESPAIAAPFFLVDLRVHDEQGNAVIGKATAVPGKAMVKVYEPAWKAQIKEQIASERGVPVGGEVSPQLQHSTEIAEQMTPKLPEVSNSANSGANSVDALSETLSDLGYGVEKK